MAELEQRLSELTVANVGDGEFASEFNRCLDVVHDVFDHRNEYVSDKGGNIAIRIVGEIVFVQSPDGAVSVVVGANAKIPKRLTRYRPVHRRNGALYTYHEPEQLALTSGVTGIGRGQGGGAS